MTDRVTVLRTLDLAKADLFEELLRDQGIKYLRAGQNPAVLGAGMAEFEHRFDVARGDGEHASDLLAFIERAETDAVTTVPAKVRGLSESTHFRRLIEVLLRVWFYWWGGFILVIPAIWLCHLARAHGISTLRLLTAEDLPSFSFAVAVAVSFAPSGWRKRGAVLGVLTILLVAVFATSG